MSNSRRALCALAGVVVTAYLAAFFVVMSRGTYDAWAALLVVPALFAVMVPVAVREARRESDATLVTLILTAFALKMAAAVVRYVVAFDVYSTSDADIYHSAGVSVADSFRQGIFEVDVGGKLIGTNFVKLLTGVVYTATGPTRLGAFFVFAFIGFWGLLFLYKAFRTGVPDGDHRRYALLIFFLPSLLFWPSSMGKDAWILFGIGLAAMGGARLYAQRSGGYLLVAAGLVALDLVRPHVALLILLPLFVAFLFRRGRSGDVLARTGTKVVGTVVLLVAAGVVMTKAETFLGVDRFNSDTVNQVLTDVEGRTGQGGSQFSAPNARSPIGFPVAFVSVLFRPFPTEAHGVGQIIASLEGLFLIALAIASWRRLRRLPRLLVREPYLLFCLIYVVLFVFAFSSFGNFGILARQRVQVFPFVLALLSLCPEASPDRRPAAPTAADTTPTPPGRPKRRQPLSIHCAP